MCKEPPAKRASKQTEKANDTVNKSQYISCPNSRMTEQDCNDLAKKFGGKTNGKAFTKSSEGNSKNTKFAHWPGGASGVTLGYGYDLKHRTKKEVYKALIDAGVNENDANKLSDGVKLTNKNAQNFVNRNDIAKIAFTEDQKNKLFDVVYKENKDDVKRINAKTDVQKKYGYTPWEKLNPTIQDILIDLRYRGDYTPKTRQFLQKHVASNTLSEFTKAICNPDNWKSVPNDRRERRCKYAKWKEQCESSQNKQKNNLKLVLGKAELKAFRQKIGLADDIHTIGVAKTDIPSLQNITFEGASPKVRKLAGLPDATSGPIKSPNPNPLFTRHAEEDIANQFVAKVEKTGLTQAELEGRTLLMHISNPTGVCNVCRQGIKNPNVKPGVLKQLSEKYPNLTIKVTIESGVEKVKGGTELLIQNGKFVN